MIGTLVAMTIAGGLLQTYNPTGPKVEVKLDNGKSFVITTDAKGAPKTTEGILKLVKEKFYDGILVHRVEDWVVQWGDPQTKTKGVDAQGIGSGGSGKPLPFEAGKGTFVKGAVGIASTGAGVGGDAQLFVVLKDAAFLDGKYALCGKVTSGMDVVEKMTRGTKVVSMRVMPSK